MRYDRAPLPQACGSHAQLGMGSRIVVPSLQRRMPPRPANGSCALTSMILLPTSERCRRIGGRPTGSSGEGQKLVGNCEGLSHHAALVVGHECWQRVMGQNALVLQAADEAVHWPRDALQRAGVFVAA